MGNRFFALLVHGETEWFESLKSVLHQLSVETYSVSNVREAAKILPQTEPHLIFTAPTLPDGSWPAVMKMAKKGAVPVNVIVVGPQKSLKLYISTITRGAFDCVTPPFELQSLDPVVWAAGEDVRHRRLALARSAAAEAETRGANIRTGAAFEQRFRTAGRQH
jgi:DNA-binding NtrC family response regulator